MELATARLPLREYIRSDTAAVHAFASDPRTTIFVDWGPKTEQETRELIQFALTKAVEVPRTSHILAISLAGQVIGSVGLTVKVPGAGIRFKRHGNGQHRADGRLEAEIGYTLRPDHWGQGIATEASAAVIDFGFSQLGLDRITATCRPENVASAGVLQKWGCNGWGCSRTTA